MATLELAGINGLHSDLNDTIAEHGAENISISFFYNGKYRVIRPFKLEGGNISSLEMSAPGAPFKYFSVRNMENVRMTLTRTEEETTEEIDALLNKLDAIKIFRPQHVATADALAEVAQSVVNMYTTASNLSNTQARETMIAAADALRDTISLNVDTLAI